MGAVENLRISPHQLRLKVTRTHTYTHTHTLLERALDILQISFSFSMRQMWRLILSHNMICDAKNIILSGLFFRKTKTFKLLFFVREIIGFVLSLYHFIFHETNVSFNVVTQPMKRSRYNMRCNKYHTYLGNLSLVSFIKTTTKRSFANSYFYRTLLLLNILPCLIYVKQLDPVNSKRN